MHTTLVPTTAEPYPPHILDMQRAFKIKAERVLHDPCFRANQPASWWQDDRRTLNEAIELHRESCSLDPWKFSVDLPHSDSYDQRFRFQRYALERAYWLDHLPSVELSTERIERFEQCGRGAYLQRDWDDGSYALRADTCKLRICPACRQRYRFAAVDRIRDLLKDLKPQQWQFITLTVRHTRAPLKIQTDFLKDAFRRLRQRKLWKSACEHGYAVLEITYNDEKDEWHPHLHVLVRCRYIDWRALRKDWIAVTNGSHAIDCGYVRSGKSAADYIAKYLAKPPVLASIPSTERLKDYYSAIQHSRFLMPFGKPPKPKKRPPLDKPRRLEPLGSLTELRNKAAAGDQTAARHLRAFFRQCDAKNRAMDPDLRDTIDPTVTSDPCDLFLAPQPP